MKKQNFLATQNMQKKQVKKKASAYSTPAKLKGRPIRPNRNQGTSR